MVGEYHVGEFINRFRKGSLAMQAPETGAIVPSTLLFGTVNGVLGLVASISTEEYALLAKVCACRAAHYEKHVKRAAVHACETSYCWFGC